MKIFIKISLSLFILFFYSYVSYSETNPIWTEISRPVKDRTSPWSEIIKHTKNSIVAVETSATTINILQPHKTPSEVALYGSGFFINKEGYILTNAHVVIRVKKIHIKTQKSGHEKFEVDLVGRFGPGDIAILKLSDKERDKFIEYHEEITFLSFTDSDDVVEGEDVLSLGYPLRKPNLTITEGIVSGFTRSKRDNYQYIQTNSALNRGNSGGPSLDKNGAVIGINSSVIRKAENMGFMIPVNYVKVFLSQLFYNNHKAYFPSLGIGWSWNYEHTAKYLKSPDKKGIIITALFPGGTFDKAGLQELDVLTEINGVPLDFYGERIMPNHKREHIRAFLHRFPVDSTLPIQYYREGKEFSKKVKLLNPVDLPIRYLKDNEEPDYEIWGGMIIQQLNMNIIRILKRQSMLKYSDPTERFTPAVVITHIFRNSEAHKNRILGRGDIIEKINRKEVFTLEDVRNALETIKDQEYFIVETTEGKIAALDVKNAIEQEPFLRKTHKYNASRPNKE